MAIITCRTSETTLDMKSQKSIDDSWSWTMDKCLDLSDVSLGNPPPKASTASLLSGGLSDKDKCLQKTNV